MKRASLLWLLAVASAGIACTREARPNILLIVIDTLRPDRLGAYGSQRALTPFIDSVTDRAVVFRNAYAQTSWTNASIASLLTSRYQSQHRVISFKSALAAQEHTLPEVLKEHGFTTGGFSANFLLSPSLGFDQGFDRYQVFADTDKDRNGKTIYVKERAPKVNQAGLAWLDEVRRQQAARAPVFLYLHYMEPHNPYHPPDAFLDHVLGDRARPDQAAVNLRMRLPNIGRFSDEIVQSVQDLYDAEVMSIDAELRILFSGLQERGFLDNAVVVIVADHGEEFREHGLMGHHQTLFEEVIRVPFIVVPPGQRQRKDILDIVSLTDVAPTLLALVGVAPPPTFTGHSLREAMGVPGFTKWPFTALTRSSGTGGASPPFAFTELIKETTDRERPHERAVVTKTGKLILNVNGEREYYDLHGDPGETNPQGLAELQRGQLSTDLSQLTQLAPAHPTPKGTVVMDAETRERMRALGYTE